MEVLLKFGRYAGEVRDVRADCALQMIEDGRATDPRVPVEEVPVLSLQTVVHQPIVPAILVGRRGRRK
jgi:hypothetical protein